MLDEPQILNLSVPGLFSYQMPLRAPFKALLHIDTYWKSHCALRTSLPQLSSHVFVVLVPSCTAQLRNCSWRGICFLHNGFLPQ